MKKLAALLVIGVFLAGTAWAEKVEHPKHRLYPTPHHMVSYTRDYFEGFENTFPPVGWTTTITNASYTWGQDSYPYEGLYGAYIGWQAGTPQDEWLKFSYAIASGENHLVFATMGSPYWTMNADFQVWVNGVMAWSFYNDWTGGDFEWGVIDIDLSSYIGQTVEIGFRYVGDDGADHHLDAVAINGGYTPPPPPENDTCDGAIVLPCGPVNVSGSTELAADDYSPGEYGTSCTGYQALGNDVVYKMVLPSGADVDLTYSCSFDNSLYIVTDCADPINSCVVGADATVSGVEQIIATLAPGTYYVIVDAYGSGYGHYSLTGDITCAGTATQKSTWGKVKKKWR
ncbi:MAG: choice-of-anchor J domain-containing protein [Candidatus Eisenbacteria bacterium]|nr:choice-of-anchor J domain-containing protein [Candidatus Eisenbacteria bacterium]